MKHDDEHDLLTQLFSAENLTGLRQASLQSGLAALRRRRRIRRLVQASSVVCLALFLGSAILLLFGFPRHLTNNLAHNGGISPTPGLEHDGVKIITDEELFALFPNRPMALVGNPGRQQLVFLDQPAVTQ